MSIRAAMRWELLLARRSRAIQIVLVLLVASLAAALWSGFSYRERWDGEVARHLDRGAKGPRMNNRIGSGHFVDPGVPSSC
jgi:hypothetical protein